MKSIFHTDIIRVYMCIYKIQTVIEVSVHKGMKIEIINIEFTNREKEEHVQSRNENINSVICSRVLMPEGVNACY